MDSKESIQAYALLTNASVTSNIVAVTTIKDNNADQLQLFFSNYEAAPKVCEIYDEKLRPW